MITLVISIKHLILPCLNIINYRRILPICYLVVSKNDFKNRSFTSITNQRITYLSIRFIPDFCIITSCADNLTSGIALLFIWNPDILLDIIWRCFIYKLLSINCQVDEIGIIRLFRAHLHGVCRFGALSSLKRLSKQRKVEMTGDTENSQQGKHLIRTSPRPALKIHKE